MAELSHVITHVSVGTNDFDRAVAFYDKVLAILGCKRMMEFPGAVGWGYLSPEFWVQKPIDGEKAVAGNGTHIAFAALSKEVVHQFYDAAIKAGATCDGPPGPRSNYTDAYYGCFVRDPDGHKIEAMYWDMETYKKMLGG